MHCCTPELVNGGRVRYSAADEDGNDYYYVEGELIVADGAMDHVAANLPDDVAIRDARPKCQLPPDTGYTLFELDGDVAVPEVVRHVGGPPLAFPNHVFVHPVEPDHPTQPGSRCIKGHSHPNWFPYSTPIPVERMGLVKRADTDAPTVGILDTGWFFYPEENGRAKGYNDWLREWFRGHLHVADGDVVVPKQGSRIPLATGHGAFEASVVLQAAPNVHVIGAGAPFNECGMISDCQLALALYDKRCVLGEAEILSFSFGAYTHDNAGPKAVIRILERYYPGKLIVASAGNDGTDRPNFPASLPWVVGVGALDEAKKQPALWSTWGPSIYTYAPGTNVRGGYLSGTYHLFDPDDETESPSGGYSPTYFGAASWSGTSFAAPFVAGRIAGLMERGATEQDALAAVRGTVT